MHKKSIKDQMASTVPSATVIRLLIYGRNLPQEWTIKGNYVFCAGSRFPFLTNISNHSLRSVLSIRSLHLLPHPPLRSVRKSRPPHLRPPLLSMSTTSDPDPAPQSSSTKTVRVVIKGRVQGVFYRDWTIENATQLGLNGWVRNKRDGSVEALFSGDPDKVQEMEQRCRRGPPDALVTGLKVFPCSDDPIPGTGFERKPTV